MQLRLESRPVGEVFVVQCIGKLISGWGVLDRTVNRWVVGVGLVPRGEVVFIFAGVGLGAHIITEAQYGAILVVVAITTFLSPVFLKRLLHGGSAAKESVSLH